MIVSIGPSKELYTSNDLLAKNNHIRVKYVLKHLPYLYQEIV